MKGDLIATDGIPVKPINGSQFPLAVAQRIDVRVQLPREGAFPILALRENATDKLMEKVAARRAELEAELEQLAQYDRPAKKSLAAAPVVKAKKADDKKADDKVSDEAKESIANAA